MGPGSLPILRCYFESSTTSHQWLLGNVRCPTCAWHTLHLVPIWDLLWKHLASCLPSFEHSFRLSLLSLLPWLSSHTTGHLTFMVHWVFGLLVLIFPILIIFAAGCPLVLTVSSSNSMGTSFVFMVWGLQKWTETGEGSGSIQSLCDWLRQTSSVTFFSFWRLHISKTIPGQHQINFAHAAWVTMHLPQCDFLTN